MNSALIETLRTLEVQLMDPAFRRDTRGVAALLAEEFHEFGSSGRVWSRDTILALLAEEQDYEAPAVESFQAIAVGSEAVLVTYRSVRGDRVWLRSSLWVIREGRWQMLFHQGTPVPQAQ